MKIRPDDAAFSRAGSEDFHGDMPDGNRYYPPQHDMTLRTWLAGMALQGLLANCSPAGRLVQLAESAVYAADSLIAELNKEPTP